MGVLGLWKLIEASGKPVPLDTLENKVLAIDISIWLHQVIKGFQDNKGGALAHAHLLGLFHRLCKLLYYRVKPVFVFDGGVPQLKKETIARRNRSRNKILKEADRIQQLLLSSLAKEKIVLSALGPNAAEILKSPPKLRQTKSKPDIDDIFKLPDLPNQETIDLNASTSSSSFHSCSEADSSSDGNILRHTYENHLQSIDVNSAQFKSLPADIRYEILIDIKETRKQSSWGKLHELPTQSDQFSVFQLKRLLKRNQVQENIEEVEKLMEGKSLTLKELQTFLTEEGIITASSTDATKRIMSDENTRYLLVRDLKKAIENAGKKEQEQEEEEINDLAKESNESQGKEDNIEDKQNLGDDLDEDLQRAISLSLQTSGVYKDDDYEYNKIKLNKEQRKKFQCAALSLARNYMIEYGGLNDVQVNDLFENTQIQSSQNLLSDSIRLEHNDSFIINGENSKQVGSNKISEDTAEVSKSSSVVQSQMSDVNKFSVTPKDDTIAIISSDDDSDSDLVEVVDTDKKEEKVSVKNELEIVINLAEGMKNEEDIFADVFAKESQPIILSGETSDESSELRLKLSGSSNLSGKLDIKKGKEISSDKVNASEDDTKNEADDTSEHLKISESIKPEKIGVVSSGKSKSKSSAEAILAAIKDDLDQVSKITLDNIIIPEHNSSLNNTEEIKHKESLNDYQKISDLKLQSIPKLENTSTGIANCDNENPIKNNENQKQNITGILVEDLRKEADTISNLNLDDINKKGEIIEILDDDEKVAQSKTPSKKDNLIDTYFETKYVVKRTPDKVSVEEEETTPKVKSPFFVNKTPKSSNKKRNALLDDEEEDEEPRIQSTSKASKTLFHDLNDKSINNEQSEPKNLLEIAAENLKENKTTEELQSLAENIAKEKRELEYESNRQSRMGTSITERMNAECMELLRIFGIPYIVAPMEAEAQCAFLNAADLTDGTITDDSDIWLFGGRTVYKNFFNQKKHVLEFKAENIEKMYSVDREKLVQLAILVGSDYTTGIDGIGTVTALEILAAFPITPLKEGETTQNMSVLSSLRKFRDWFKSGKTVGVGGRTTLKKKLKNIELTEGFPNSAIVEAYLSPMVDSSREKFSWGYPDVETIHEFTNKRFGWTRSKTDDILRPVLKRMNDKKIQSTIKNYFSVKSALPSPRDLKVSKRVMTAINKISKGVGISDEEEVVKAKKARKTSQKTETKKGNNSNESKTVKTTRRKRPAPNKGTEIELPEATTSTGIGSSSGNTIESSPPKILKKSPYFSTSVDNIPQKEKDILEMQNRKKLAAEVLKKAQVNKKISK